MRVTNGMIRNNTLNSLYNNMGKLDKLYTQMTTLKKIQRPSDDPIIAGRSLKLKINVLEGQQYGNNTKEATSWMSITEKALDNAHSIISAIREKCVHGANDVLETKDRQKIIADVEQLWTQLQQESNVTYMGRHVFSGYKTNEPVMLSKDTTLTEDGYAHSEMTLLKGTIIPAGGITLTDGITVLPAGLLAQDTTLPVKTISGLLTAPETLTASTFLPQGTVIPAAGITLANGTALPAGPLAQGVTVPAGTVLPDGTDLLTATVQVGTVLPAGTMLPKGTVNPNVLGKVNGQNIQYEVGVGSTIDVNTLGMDKLMNQMFEDIKEIRDALNTHEDGNPMTNADLHVWFDKKLGDFDKRLSTVSEMTADLGSKMNRLKYTATRLEDDVTNFKELLSNTEDIDLEEIYTEFNAQYAVYQSALQATSKVIMNTLADFLR